MSAVSPQNTVGVAQRQWSNARSARFASFAKSANVRANDEMDSIEAMRPIPGLASFLGRCLV
jgi:hypothetical protein